MTAYLPVALEIGRRRVFAVALDWPGWSRSGRSESEAVDALFAYGPRYAAAMLDAAPDFHAPTSTTAFEIAERLNGSAATDFGAPTAPPAADHRPVRPEEIERLIRLLTAAWTVFDHAARAANGIELQKGPRGGGRELDQIIAHVLDADRPTWLSLAAGAAARRKATPWPQWRRPVKRRSRLFTSASRESSRSPDRGGTGRSGPLAFSSGPQPGTPSTMPGRSRTAPACSRKGSASARGSGGRPHVPLVGVPRGVPAGCRRTHVDQSP